MTGNALRPLRSDWKRQTSGKFKTKFSEYKFHGIKKATFQPAVAADLKQLAGWLNFYNLKNNFLLISIQSQATGPAKTFVLVRIRKKYPLNSAIGMHLNSQRFYVFRSVCLFSVFVKGDDDLIPAAFQPERNFAQERFQLHFFLLRQRFEPSFHSVAVSDENVEHESPLQIFYRHIQERSSNGQNFSGIRRTRDVSLRRFPTPDLQHGAM